MVLAIGNSLEPEVIVVGPKLNLLAPHTKSIPSSNFRFITLERENSGENILLAYLLSRILFAKEKLCTFYYQVALNKFLN